MPRVGELTARVDGENSGLRSVFRNSEVLTRSHVARMGRLFNRLRTISVAAFAGTSFALARTITSVVAYGDEIAKSARTAGTSVRQYDALRFALEQFGIESAQTNNILVNLSNAISQARLGILNYQRQFRLLNLDVDSFSTTDQVANLRATLTALRDVGSEVSRLSAASIIFGRRFSRELGTAIAEGGDQLLRLENLGVRIGSVLTNEAARGAEHLRDRFNELSRTIRNNFYSGILEAFDPENVDLVEWHNSLEIIGNTIRNITVNVAQWIISQKEHIRAWIGTLAVITSVWVVASFLTAVFGVLRGIIVTINALLLTMRSIIVWIFRTIVGGVALLTTGTLGGILGVRTWIALRNRILKAADATERFRKAQQRLHRQMRENSSRMRDLGSGGSRIDDAADPIRREENLRRTQQRHDDLQRRQQRLNDIGRRNNLGNQGMISRIREMIRNTMESIRHTVQRGLTRIKLPFTRFFNSLGDFIKIRSLRLELFIREKILGQDRPLSATQQHIRNLQSERQRLQEFRGNSAQTTRDLFKFIDEKFDRQIRMLPQPALQESLDRIARQRQNERDRALRELNKRLVNALKRIGDINKELKSLKGGISSFGSTLSNVGKLLARAFGWLGGIVTAGFTGYSIYDYIKKAFQGSGKIPEIGEATDDRPFMSRHVYDPILQRFGFYPPDDPGIRRNVYDPLFQQFGLRQQREIEPSEPKESVQKQLDEFKQGTADLMDVIDKNANAQGDNTDAAEKNTESNESLSKQVGGLWKTIEEFLLGKPPDQSMIDDYANSLSLTPEERKKLEEEGAQRSGGLIDVLKIRSFDDAKDYVSKGLSNVFGGLASEAGKFTTSSAYNFLDRFGGAIIGEVESGASPDEKIAKRIQDLTTVIDSNMKTASVNKTRDLLKDALPDYSRIMAPDEAADLFQKVLVKDSDLVERFEVKWTGENISVPMFALRDELRELHYRLGLPGVSDGDRELIRKRREAEEEKLREQRNRTIPTLSDLQNIAQNRPPKDEILSHLRNRIDPSLNDLTAIIRGDTGKYNQEFRKRDEQEGPGLAIRQDVGKMMSEFSTRLFSFADRFLEDGVLKPIGAYVDEKTGETKYTNIRAFDLRGDLTDSFQYEFTDDATQEERQAWKSILEEFEVVHKQILNREQDLFGMLGTLSPNNRHYKNFLKYQSKLDPLGEVDGVPLHGPSLPAGSSVYAARKFSPDQIKQEIENAGGRFVEVVTKYQEIQKKMVESLEAGNVAGPISESGWDALNLQERANFIESLGHTLGIQFDNLDVTLSEGWHAIMENLKKNAQKKLEQLKIEENVLNLKRKKYFEMAEKHAQGIGDTLAHALIHWDDDGLRDRLRNAIRRPFVELFGDHFSDFLKKKLQGALRKLFAAGDDGKGFFGAVFSLFGGIGGGKAKVNTSRGGLSGLKAHGGGIVPGQFPGEANMTLRAGEMVLNNAQQRELFRMTRNGGQGGLTINKKTEVVGDVTMQTRQALREDMREMSQMIEADFRRRRVL